MSYPHVLKLSVIPEAFIWDPITKILRNINVLLIGFPPGEFGDGKASVFYRILCIDFHCSPVLYSFALIYFYKATLMFKVSRLFRNEK
ncbi:MAG TPA: hypothetical protein PKC91_07040 [Ignavibacteria bacterium]|nr:hypothetical protein [Ignavibacteria bacterium]